MNRSSDDGQNEEDGEIQEGCCTNVILVKPRSDLRDNPT
jgi:hypothetical protein